jgi:5-methyltetrahydropteroyltriglutamate--homocysteine methyltransferase
MQTSTDHIVTTHTGSLPRPVALVEALVARDRGKLDPSKFDDLDRDIREAIGVAVRAQVTAGVDVVNDGEMGKIGYSTYVKERLSGYEVKKTAPMPPALDMVDFPELAKDSFRGVRLYLPVCTGPITYKAPEAVVADAENLREAGDGVTDNDLFLSAASPGVISLFLENEYYPDHESYVFALAEAMKHEYNAIHAAGLLVQVDCPDLAMGRHVQFGGASLEVFQRNAAMHVEALNHALSDIPADRLRMHLCWGNYEGPHDHDVPLPDIFDIVMKAKPQVLLLEGANPRHEHEWAVFSDHKLPDDKVLVPGVIDSTSNYVEHPELIAQRIERYANVVGKERVMAGSDCGYGTTAGSGAVEPGVVWKKLKSLAEGARIATARLWRGA